MLCHYMYYLPYVINYDIIVESRRTGGCMDVKHKRYILISAFVGVGWTVPFVLAVVAPLIAGSESDLSVFNFFWTLFCWSGNLLSSFAVKLVPPRPLHDYTLLKLVVAISFVFGQFLAYAILGWGLSILMWGRRQQEQSMPNNS